MATAIRKYQRLLFAYHLEAKRTLLALVRPETMSGEEAGDGGTGGTSGDGKDMSAPPLLGREKDEMVPVDLGVLRLV